MAVLPLMNASLNKSGRAEQSNGNHFNARDILSSLAHNLFSQFRVVLFCPCDIGTLPAEFLQETQNNNEWSLVCVCSFGR